MDLDNSNGFDATDFEPAVAVDREPVEVTDYNLPDLIAALWRLKPEYYDDHDKWIKTGMALKDADPALFSVWDKWSQQSSKYQPGDCERVWASFKKRTDDRRITIASIYHWAGEPNTDYFSEWNAAANDRSKAKPEAEPSFFRGYDAVDFVKLPRTVNYIVDKLLVAGEPGAIGGPLKNNKTVVTADAAVSISHGIPFLGKFETQRRVVSFFSGESGTATLGERIEAIAASKNLKLERDWLHIYERPLPRFDQPKQLELLRKEIQNTGTQVLIIDPAYLCVNGEHANNIFKMGEQYGRIGGICSDLGITLLLLHHVNRAAGRDYEPLNLHDLLWSGMAEWVRQWWLISRRSAYIDGVGDSELFLRAGGSAGHSALYEIDISEGVQPNRYWRINAVKDQSEVRADDTEKQYADDRVKIAAVMETGQPEFKTNIDKAISPRLNAKRFAYAFARMVNEGEIVPIVVGKKTKFQLKESAN